MLEVTKTDTARLDNVLKALKKGTFTLEGEEILAFSQAFAWASQLKERFTAAMEKQALAEKLAAEAEANKPAAVAMTADFEKPRKRGAK